MNCPNCNTKLQYRYTVKIPNIKVVFLYLCSNCNKIKYDIGVI
jgi:hypothetical protein